MVRITPDEVHLSDANNYELINFVGSKYPKSALYDAFGIGYSTFSSRSVETHRIRRGALNPFFSRKMVLRLEHIVQDKAEKVSALTAKVFATGKAMNLHYAFRAVSVDVITEYAFAQCYNLLDRPDLGQSFFKMIQDLGPTMWIFQQWPGLQKIALGLPPAIASAMSAPIGQVLNLTEVSPPLFHPSMIADRDSIVASNVPLSRKPWIQGRQLASGHRFSKRCSVPARRILIMWFPLLMI
jgi:hypothetical protein